MLDVERLPEAVNRALADIAFNLHNVIELHTLLGELDGAIDEGLRHGSAGVGLEDNVIDDPTLAELI